MCAREEMRIFMPKDFGEVRPQRGRWIWPLTQMEIGDHFYVAHEDREPERVRNYVYVSGNRLNMTFTVEKDSERKGFTKVTRIDPEDRTIDVSSHNAYGLVRDRVLELYAFSLDEFDWHGSYPVGAIWSRAAEQRAEPRREHYVMWIPGCDNDGRSIFMSFRVSMKANGVEFQRLADSTGYTQAMEMLELMS